MIIDKNEKVKFKSRRIFLTHPWLFFSLCDRENMPVRCIPRRTAPGIGIRESVSVIGLLPGGR